MIEYIVKVYDEYTEWFLNGKRHREDGPAVEWVNGDQEWFLNGIKYSEKEFQKALNPVKEFSIEQISELLGYEVKVVNHKFFFTFI